MKFMLLRDEPELGSNTALTSISLLGCLYQLVLVPLERADQLGGVVVRHGRRLPVPLVVL